MNRFRIRVVLYILMAIGFGLATFYFILETPFWLTGCWMALFLVISVVALIRHVEKSDRDLNNFLLAIRQNDYTATYPQLGTKSKRLFRAFHQISTDFLRLRNEKETNFHFLRTVVEHSGVPLLAYHVKSGNIALANQSVKVLFHLPHFSKLTSLERVDPQLVESIHSLGSNDKVLLKVSIQQEPLYLSVVARELVMEGERTKVIAFHNINSELDQKEVESWQKLIRVMTHEIKNSVIPISTLAEVINDMLSEKGGRQVALADLSSEDEDDLLVSLRTIEKRSKGLVKFVNSYGDMARVPKPEFVQTDLCSLIRSTIHLQKKQLDLAGIQLDLSLPGHPELRSVDPEMIEQVLINLIKNAQEALVENKVVDGLIRIGLTKQQGELIVIISDNGLGMDPEIQEQIFIPFFTTKSDGSGIGLSYSKQIMRAHHGSVRFRSTPETGTTFELVFWSI